nr:hypothetical protein [Fodinicola feengrottensis]
MIITSFRTSAGVIDGQLQTEAGAVAVAQDIRGGGVQVPQEGSGVIGHLLVRKRAVEVGGPAVSLLLGRDHLVIFG